VNQLKAKEAVRKCVRFLEPSIWQRQRPTRQQIPVQTTGSLNQSSVFFRTGELHDHQSHFQLMHGISRKINLSRLAVPLLPRPQLRPLRNPVDDPD
jgi:hypothetical protein